MLKGFKQFILRGNVVDLAVGVVIGAAFGNLVTALVKDILTPFLGVITQVPDFSGLMFTIRGSQFLYGEFLNTLIAFLLVSVAVYFFVVTPMNTLVARMRKEAPMDPTTKKCPECLSEIPRDAKRCAHCGERMPDVL
jgi:large conductance mechanosensitive channel